MLPKHHNPERGEPPTSPALARRRDHMLRSDAARHIEPRLVPSADEEQPSFLTEPEFEDEADPDIPPPPPTALRVGDADVPRRASQPADRSKLWLAGGAAVVIAAAGAAAWFIHGKAPESSGNGAVPYVAADAGPEKIRPQQEVGSARLTVPGQDDSPPSFWQNLDPCDRRFYHARRDDLSRSHAGEPE